MAATSCPECGGKGLLNTNMLLSLYRCTKCREEYEVVWNTCRECGDWIDDDREYSTARIMAKNEAIQNLARHEKNGMTRQNQ